MTTRAAAPPSLTDARCACGSAAIVAILVGREPLRLGAVDIRTRRDRLLRRGTPDRFWCRACWPIAQSHAA
jgi:hypothetical protein